MEGLSPAAASFMQELAWTQLEAVKERAISRLQNWDGVLDASSWRHLQSEIRAAKDHCVVADALASPTNSDIRVHFALSLSCEVGPRGLILTEYRVSPTGLPDLDINGSGYPVPDWLADELRTVVFQVKIEKTIPLGSTWERSDG